MRAFSKIAICAVVALAFMSGVQAQACVWQNECRALYDQRYKEAVQEYDAAVKAGENAYDASVEKRRKQDWAGDVLIRQQSDAVDQMRRTPQEQEYYCLHHVSQCADENYPLVKKE